MKMHWDFNRCQVVQKKKKCYLEVKFQNMPTGWQF